MTDDRDGFRDDSSWVAAAVHLEPIVLPEPPRPHRREARRALALALLGVVCLGFVFGPLALVRGQRARFALLDDPHAADAGVARAAIAIGKVGLAIHLAIAISIIPWLLFVLPLAHRAGG